MWLVRLDRVNGLVEDSDPSLDGWMAISLFREVRSKYGIEGFTVLSLTCDYLSPFRNYSDLDRPFKAQDEVYGSRDVLDFANDELLISASLKYRELQFNVDMERNMLNSEIERELVSQLSDAYSSRDDVKIQTASTRLDKHSESVKKFKSDFDINTMIKDHSITHNKYKLTRIELDLATRRHSKFRETDRSFPNPDKLGLKTVEPKKKKNSIKKK